MLVKTILIPAIVIAGPLFAFYRLKSREKKHIRFDERMDPKSFIKLNSGWTHYELSGPDSAPVVVLIHGGSIPFCIWDYQMDILLKNGYRVLRYDHFGKGLSERINCEYSRELYTNQLSELLYALKIDTPVNLVGPSFGGAIAASFSARYPDRVNSIIFISPVLNLNNSNSPLLKPINMSRLPIIGDYLFHTIILDKIIDRGINLLRNSTNIDSFKSQFFYSGTEKSFTSTFKSDAYDSYRDACRIINIKIKNILLLRGVEDTEVTPEMITEAIEDMPNCTFMEIESTGHSPNSEGPERFNSILIEHLKSCCITSN